MHPTLCRLLWVGSLFGIVGVLAVTGGKLGAPGFIVYEDAKDRFTIERPRGWIDSSRLTFRMPGEVMFIRRSGGSAALGVARVEPPPTPLENDPNQPTPMQRVSDDLVKHFWTPSSVPSATQQAPPTPMPIRCPKTGKVIWHGLQTEFTVPRKDQHIHLICIVLQASNGYWALFTAAPEDEWPELRKDMEHSLSSFRPGGS